jgi:membrane-associated protein
MSLLDPVSLIHSGGMLAIFLIILAESGLFFAFFLPGDSLLFASGILASQGYVSLSLVILTVFVAGMLGGIIGYIFGKKVGPKIFTKDESVFFKRSHIARTEKFFARYGAYAVMLARFAPIVRTFMPIIAGVGHMKKRWFLTFNMLGALAWAIIVPVLGYYVGPKIPNVDAYIMPVIIGIIIISIIPLLFSALIHKKNS